MSRFHHLWIVEAELEVRNPTPDGDAHGERIFSVLSRYAAEETEPYPTQCRRTDDGWLEVTFPVWAPTRWAAIAAGSAMLAEACADARTEPGVARISAGESRDELEAYRARFSEMEATQRA